MHANTAFRRSISAILVVATATLAATTSSRAQQATVTLAVKGHHFQPAEAHAPANRPLAIRVRNLDATAMEFESVSLRVEKVVAPGSTGVVHVRPLAAGRYEFFDDFHHATRGVLVVR